MNKSINDIVFATLEKHLAMTAEEIEAMQIPEDDGLYDVLLEMCKVANVQEFFVNTGTPLLLSTTRTYSTNTNRYTVECSCYNGYLPDGEFLWAA